ncbi:hypothetical protein Tfer_2740 [Thermincola ferriacetica]|uniref:Uncharacterized protein n=1 Tax=Thermincola ferriacetica TaxID=281456 RepID=A0A0L6W0P0_9FIRM|nr:hypothetical protein [Thermincola ferriacetica]KNZ68649.1 hypothetical protein Tfer_2740 [Thermincola ferriacetica]
MGGGLTALPPTVRDRGFPRRRIFMESIGIVKVDENDPRLAELMKDLDALGAQVSSGNKPAASKLADEIAERLNVLPVLVVQAGFRQCMLGKRPEAAVYLLGLSDMAKAMFEQLAADPDCGPGEAMGVILALMQEIARQNSIGKVGVV